MNINRRAFTTRMALTGLASWAYPLAASTTTDESSRAQLFERALAQKPWLLGYRTATADRFDGRAVVSGRWPSALRGHFYRNGPARHEIGEFRYGHWFDGDGMLQKYSIGPEGVSHSAALIETHKVRAERNAGRALFGGFGSNVPNPAPVTSPDATNVANISVLHHHGKLLALWEAGSPWEIDADNLATSGTYEFASDRAEFNMAGVPFSAHPRVEADGTLWNFGYLSGANLLVFWHIDKQGKLVKAGKITSDPMTMPHDFLVTSRHIVIMMPPLKYERHTRTHATTFLDAHRWDPSSPTRILVIDKNDFDNHFWLEGPPQWVFHYGNAWEDNAGVIRFDGARANDPSIMFSTFREIMSGREVQSAHAEHHQYRIDTKARTFVEAPMLGNNWATEFPTIDSRVSCQRNRKITMMANNQLEGQSIHGGLNTVMHLDVDNGHHVSYRYPDHQIPEEHLYVADRSQLAETGGWVVGTALDWKTETTLLNVFHADALNNGPVAQARLGYALPLGLHAKFVHA